MTYPISSFSLCPDNSSVVSLPSAMPLCLLQGLATDLSELFCTDSNPIDQNHIPKNTKKQFQ